MFIQSKQGKVILAAAGPGDPELVTLKTVRYLQKAEVVLTDRLVSDGILKHVPATAKVLYVGKQCGRGISTSQATINELMVHHAKQGKLVVRLKGGDVSIFSNVLDELQALSEHRISYEIVPGVTAALGAAAYSGIPLTARGYATAVRFLTYYKKELVTEAYWKELAATDDTLVFYMSSGTLDEIVHYLTENNISPDKLLAVVEQATTPNQQVYTSNLYEYANTLQGKQFVSPSLVIVGKVVALHQQFQWIANAANTDTYFKTVASLPNPYQNNKAQQHVTRA